MYHRFVEPCEVIEEKLDADEALAGQQPEPYVASDKVDRRAKIASREEPRPREDKQSRPQPKPWVDAATRQERSQRRSKMFDLIDESLRQPPENDSGKSLKACEREHRHHVQKIKMNKQRTRVAERIERAQQNQLLRQAEKIEARREEATCDESITR